MKRKLIEYDVFKKIREDSLSAAETELTDAEGVLAKALDIDYLSLHCFGESDVTYGTADNDTFIHATYRIQDKHIILENIEELVIDDTTSKKQTRNLLNSMVNELLNNNDIKANQAFEEYMKMPSVRRGLMEGAPEFWVDKKAGKTSTKKRGPQTPDVIAKRVRAKKKSQSLLSSSQKKQAKLRRDSLKKQFGKGVHVHTRFKKQAPAKKVNEWANLTENVLNYLEYQEFGPVLNQCDYKHDDKGNVTAIRLPVKHVRNENKLLSFNWKTMKTDLEILRGKVKKVHEDTNFCRAMADLRKCNACSDTNATQTTMEKVVKVWPELLYLTQTELQSEIAEALQSIGEVNFDDDVCQFMAEGILRTASEAYPERVKRIISLAGVELAKDDSVYEAWQDVVHQFYPKLDEASHIEMQVFVELYNALVEINKMAIIEGNEMLKGETNSFLTELYAVLQQEHEPTLELAGEIATWLSQLVEANVQYSSDTWNVSNTPSDVYPGDHPQMAKNAKVAGIPSDHPGEWGGKTPVSDGKSYRGGLEDEMRNRSWGNITGKTWPELDNPNILKPFGDYKMKEKSAVDDGQSDWSRFQSSDTWPALQNPNVKESPWRKGNYKMKSDDLIEDK